MFQAFKELPFESSSQLDFLWLEITSKCNLTCRHCYAESSPQRSLRGSMTFEDWKKVIESAASLGCRQLQFIGGEPTIHPEFRDLVDTAVVNGFSFIEVYTNATSLTEDLACFLAARGVRVATSFYSDDAVSHDRVTGKVGSFEQTMRGIRRALEAKLPVRAGVIETINNLGHSDRAGVLLESMGVSNIGYDRERGIGRGLGGGKDPMSELCGECWKGKLCVTADAETFPCVFSRFVSLGDAKEHGLQSIMESGKLSQFRSQMRDAQAAAPKTGPICGPECVPNCTPASGCSPCEPNGGAGCNPDKNHCNPMDPCRPFDPKPPDPNQGAART